MEPSPAPKPSPAPIVPPGGGLRPFLTIWIGQVLSVMGTGVSRFGLGVWVFQTTGSITQYTLITFAGTLPGLLVSPFAGALVDRLDRRTVLVASDLCSGLAILTIGLLYWQGGLAIWHLYLYMMVTSVLDAFQIPAFLATPTVLVSREHFGRVGGLLQIGPAMAQMVAPLTGGFLMVSYGLLSVVLVDVVTFLVAVSTLLSVRIPNPPKAPSELSLWQDFLEGWRFVRDRRALFGLLLFFAALNLVFSLSMVLITPMVLSFSTAAVLGTVMALSSAGLFCGGILTSLLGNPRRRIDWMLLGGCCQGLGMILVGLRPEPWLIGLGLFVVTFFLAVVNGNSQALWQVKVPPRLQGRVFSVRRIIAHATQPLGQLIAGPLAAQIFEPLMMPGGALAPSLGPILGVGPGRGIGLILVTFAVVPMLISAAFFFDRGMRYMEDELPDMVDEDMISSGEG